MQLTDILLIATIIIGVSVLALLLYIAYLLSSFMASLKMTLGNMNELYKKFSLIGKTLSSSGEKLGRTLFSKIKKKKDRKKPKS